MKHIVNIAFDFDDDRVEKILNESVEQQVRDDIRQKILNKIFEKQWDPKRGRLNADPNRDPLQYWVSDYVKTMLKDSKEDICRAAAKELAESMMKSTKWKQLVIEALKETKE